MARTAPSKAELAELATTHLYYEVAMLRGSGAEHRRRRIERPDIEGLNRAAPERVSCMAFFEAALMHARVLNDFLTARPNTKRYPEDVWAGDYITNWKAPNPGPLKRSEAIGSNRAIKDAIDKQLAHLSIRRVRGQRRFDIDGIVDAFVHDMSVFANDLDNRCYAELEGVRHLLNLNPWRTES